MWNILLSELNELNAHFGVFSNELTNDISDMGEKDMLATYSRQTY